MHELIVAETVVATRVESYGPKLQASWLDRGGRTLASIAQPLTKANEVRAFVRDWERFRHEQQLPAVVVWRDNEMIP